MKTERHFCTLTALEDTFIVPSRDRLNSAGPRVYFNADVHTMWTTWNLQARGIYAKSHGQKASNAQAKSDAKSKVKRGSWLYIQKRNVSTHMARFSLGGGWSRMWCSGDGARFYTPGSDGTFGVQEEGMVVTSCCQQNREQTDRRFCFEVNGKDGNSMVCQAGECTKTIPLFTCGR